MSGNDQNPNGYVRWPQMLTVIIILLTAVIALASFFAARQNTIAERAQVNAQELSTTKANQEAIQRTLNRIEDKIDQAIYGNESPLDDQQTNYGGK